MFGVLDIGLLGKGTVGKEHVHLSVGMHRVDLVDAKPFVIGDIIPLNIEEVDEILTGVVKADGVLGRGHGWRWCRLYIIYVIWSYYRVGVGVVG